MKRPAGQSSFFAIADCRLQIADCRLPVADCRKNGADFSKPRSGYDPKPRVASTQGHERTKICKPQRGCVADSNRNFFSIPNVTLIPLQ
jgi:hypothetical protein